jgi:hypothetical protein
LSARRRSSAAQVAPAALESFRIDPVTEQTEGPAPGKTTPPPAPGTLTPPPGALDPSRPAPAFEQLVANAVESQSTCQPCE